MVIAVHNLKVAYCKGINPNMALFVYPLYTIDVFKVCMMRLIKVVNNSTCGYCRFLHMLYAKTTKRLYIKVFIKLFLAIVFFKKPFINGIAIMLFTVSFIKFFSVRFAEYYFARAKCLYQAFYVILIALSHHKLTSAQICKSYPHAVIMLMYRC